MGEPANENDNWSIEGHFNGRFPTSSFAWTESNASDWFKEPFLQCESELLPESDSARPTPLGQSQEEDEGKRRYSYSSFEFTSSTPPTSIASSSTFTTVSDTPTILHRGGDDGASARSESDHSYSRDRECVKPQGQDTGGGGAIAVWQRPITGRATPNSGDPSPLIGRQFSASQHPSDPLRSTRSGYVTKQKPTSRFARMTKTALRACHTLETQPGILLQRAMKNTDPMLFSRLGHDADKYSNLEEFSLLKSSANACEPLTIAVASPEASQIFKSTWNAMNCQNHATMLRPPFGPASPSNCIIGPIADPSISTLPHVEEAIRMTSLGIAAAPRNVDGLPAQCSDWCKAPALPLPQYRSDSVSYTHLTLPTKRIV